MDTIRLVILFFLMTLAGCQIGVQPMPEVHHESASLIEYRNTRFQYAIGIPRDSFASRSTTGASVGFANYDIWTPTPPIRSYNIGIVAEHISSCTGSLTGASKTTRLQDAN